VTFFSDSRLEILSAKLQNNKIHDLLRRISTIINSKVKATSSTSTLRIPERSLPPLDHALATKYILSMSSFIEVYHTSKADNRL
jgi:hypothetical protein